MVFDSTRPGTLGGPDIYTTTRSSVYRSWSEPVNLGPTINTASSETRASLSWDGRTLVFGSNRPGGELAPDGVTVSNDIYITTRKVS
jgi:Tol biopolymer transport system component